MPEGDPFENDLLGREEPANILSNLVASIEGPCVIAVDAAWGTGKTTFLKLWARHLSKEGFSVVEFNAWETDFSGDPFLALSTELTEDLADFQSPTLVKQLERTKARTKEVLRATLPGAVSLLTGGGVDLKALLEAWDGMSEYQEARKALKNFRDSLQDLAKALAESNEGRPLVIVIDELDRCRPSYAIELLEAAKHLFAVDGVVFVLALNRAELAHSIKTLYGVGFDAVGYLRRFIDVDFRLPDPDRTEFIDQALNAIRISEYFERTVDQDAKHDREEEVSREWLKLYFGSPDFSLRRIAKAIHHLGLVFATLPSDRRSYAITAVVALTLRTANSELYYKFGRGEASDLDVVDQVFKENPGLSACRQQHAGRMFEALIILAATEIAGTNEESINTELVRRYRKEVDDEGADSTAKKHARAVLSILKRLSEGSAMDYGTVGRRFGYKETVRRLELLSPSLIAETREADSRHP